MKIEWLNPDLYLKDLPEVTSPKIYSKKGFDPNGLFSERILDRLRIAHAHVEFIGEDLKLDRFVQIAV